MTKVSINSTSLLHKFIVCVCVCARMSTYVHARIKYIDNAYLCRDHKHLLQKHQDYALLSTKN